MDGSPKDPKIAGLSMADIDQRLWHIVRLLALKKGTTKLTGSPRVDGTSPHLSGKSR
jgi:hypothetical protein